MKSTKTTIDMGGGSFVVLLAILFITLKLTNAITWSWWWVLSPIWISVAIWLLLIAVAFIVAIVALKGDK